MDAVHILFDTDTKVLYAIPFTEIGYVEKFLLDNVIYLSHMPEATSIVARYIYHRFRMYKVIYTDQCTSYKFILETLFPPAPRDIAEVAILMYTALYYIEQLNGEVLTIEDERLLNRIHLPNRLVNRFLVPASYDVTLEIATAIHDFLDVLNQQPKSPILLPQWTPSPPNPRSVSPIRSPLRIPLPIRILSPILSPSQPSSPILSPSIRSPSPTLVRLSPASILRWRGPARSLSPKLAGKEPESPMRSSSVNNRHHGMVTRSMRTQYQ